MKNSTYNTGRTVTINLDTLGNADIWQLFQILTDHTGNAFYGNEEEASPAADPDAACEVFLHIAETADDRADGADPVQKLFLQGIKEEYKEIFETNPADDLRERLERHAAPANEEPEEEPAADDDADDDAPENNTDAYDAVWHYLGRPEGEFLWRILEEAAADAKQDPTNLFKAGQFEGAARMLAAAIVNDGADGGEGIAAITRAAYDFCGVGW